MASKPTLVPGNWVFSPLMTNVGSVSTLAIVRIVGNHRDGFRTSTQAHHFRTCQVDELGRSVLGDQHAASTVDAAALCEKLLLAVGVLPFAGDDAANEFAKV